MLTWRWCCCERRCPSPRRLCLPSQLVAWHQTWHDTRQRRLGSSTAPVQTCPGHHLCTWASPFLYRPADETLHTYSIWQAKLSTDTTGRQFILLDKTDPCAVLPYLVKPAEETEAAGRRLRCVEAGSAPRVVVVNSCCLRDTVQQLVVWHSGIETKMLAHNLEIITSTSNKKKRNY